jgi:hypothetical protein
VRREEFVGHKIFEKKIGESGRKLEQKEAIEVERIKTS